MAEINLDFYSGEDHYSDGNIENDILNIVKNNSDYTSILQQNTSWPVMYHLSPIRRNLLEWYDFAPNATLLEIGGGCGAFSGMFAQKLKTVKVVELSKRRAEIIYERHKNYTNLEIIVGNISEVNFHEKFDYITLVGVLEYAGKFIKENDIARIVNGNDQLAALIGKNPFQALLVMLRRMLTPNGTLIIAIENKFGLKYWAGAKEDHTGRNFDSIEGYPQDKSVQTFSKHELNKLLNVAEFTTTEYYYPMPDYKLPKIIYSDDYLPDETAFFDAASPNFDQPRYVLFNEDLAYRNIISSSDGKMFDFFANSFLVFAS